MVDVVLRNGVFEGGIFYAAGFNTVSQEFLEKHRDTGIISKVIGAGNAEPIEMDPVQPETKKMPKGKTK